MLITVMIIVCIVNTTYTHIIQSGLTIHFIDVGQGDSMFITTENKKILIDGGGSNNQDFDVGESILLPYLLNRKVKTLDYIIISHFDMDHIGRNSNYFRKYKSKASNDWEASRNLRKLSKVQGNSKEKENKSKRSQEAVTQ